MPSSLGLHHSRSTDKRLASETIKFTRHQLVETLPTERGGYRNTSGRAFEVQTDLAAGQVMLPKCRKSPGEIGQLPRFEVLQAPRANSQPSATQHGRAKDFAKWSTTQGPSQDRLVTLGVLGLPAASL